MSVITRAVNPRGFACYIAIIGLMDLGISVHARGDAPDWCSMQQDFFTPVPADAIQTRYEHAIFRVETGKDHTFLGNAALVSPEGYLLTAAHVVADAQGKQLVPPLWVSRPGRDNPRSIERYSAEINYFGEPGYTPATVRQDVAVLRITDPSWKNRALTENAVPLRYTGEHFNDGHFMTFPDPEATLSKIQAERITLELVSREGPLRGAAFHGMSGSLVIDDYGFGEGIVAAFNNLAADEVKGHGGWDPTVEYYEHRIRFGAAPIEPGDKWLTSIPVDTIVQGIVDHCGNHNIDSNDIDALNIDKYKVFSLYDIDRLYSACKGITEFSPLISLYLQSHCVRQEDLISVYKRLPVSEKVKIGHKDIEDYINDGYSEPSVNNPKYLELLESYVTLADAAETANAAEKKDLGSSLYVDLARAKYELALAGHRPLTGDSPIAKSIIADLKQAKGTGADYGGIVTVAKSLATARYDWNSAAALVAAEARASGAN